MFVVHHECDVPVQLPLELCAGLVPNVRRVALLACDFDSAAETVQAVPGALAPKECGVRRKGKLPGEVKLQ